MLKGEQAIMRLKTYEKEAAQNKHVNAKTRQTKNQGFWAMASRMLEQVCARKINPVYAGQIMCTQILIQKT